MRLGRRLNRRALFAAGYLVLALLCLGLLFRTQQFPHPVFFAVFAIPYVWLEIHSVEINDKLRVSSSVMVLLSAGVWFGEGAAALGMACMAGLWPLVPADIQQRRVFFPVVNFAQYVISAAAAGLVLDLMIRADLSGPTLLVNTALAAVAAATVHSILTSLQVRLIVRVGLRQSQVAPWTDMGRIIATFAVLGAIGGMLGATLKAMNNIVLLPIFFVIYLIGQLAFQSYADLRQAHESTVRGFIKTLEAKDMFMHGHTARVATFAGMIGEELDYTPNQLERLRWAALLHDVGAVAVPRDLLRNRRSLTDEEQAQLLANMENVEQELLESDFLRPMMERAARLRMRFSESPKDEITADAQVLAVAKWFDSVTNTRVQGQAMTQERALAQLRAESPYRYDPKVVEAFARVLQASGFQYGAVEYDSTKTLEDYAKEAMYDR